MHEMTEFYQNWMIVLVKVEKNYQFLCYSPLGETLSNESFYHTQLVAMQAATQLIDQLIACAALRSALRELFETSNLSLEEWKQLSQSLDYTARIQFIRSIF